MSAFVRMVTLQTDAFGERKRNADANLLFQFLKRGQRFIIRVNSKREEIAPLIGVGRGGGGGGGGAGPPII